MIVAAHALAVDQAGPHLANRFANVGNEQMELLLSRQLGSLSAPQPLTAELEPRWSPPAGLALLAGKRISGLPTGCGAP
jgi:hypothetical protein